MSPNLVKSPITGYCKKLLRGVLGVCPAGGGGGGGGYSQKNWVDICSPLPKTPTIFKAKMSDFFLPYVIPYLRADH